MNKVFISLGSNTADGEINLNNAIRMISEKAAKFQFSSIYETEPVGEHKHAKYKNCVGLIYTTESFDVWQQFFKTIEKEMGRTPELKLTGNVPVDLDIVIWNEEVKRPKEISADYFRIGLEELNRATTR